MSSDPAVGSTLEKRAYDGYLKAQQDREKNQRAQIRKALRLVKVRPHDPRQLVYLENPGDIARSLLYRVIR